MSQCAGQDGCRYRPCCLTPSTQPVGRHRAALIGSRTVPIPKSITELLNHLAAIAERDWRGCETPADAVASLRACAPWMAGVLALLLALRMRLEYKVPAGALLTRDRVRFNDKHGEAFDREDVSASAISCTSMSPMCG